MGTGRVQSPLVGEMKTANYELEPDAIARRHLANQENGPNTGGLTAAFYYKSRGMRYCEGCANYKLRKQKGPLLKGWRCDDCRAKP